MTIDETRAAEERAYRTHMLALDAATAAWRERDPRLADYVAAVDITRTVWMDAMSKLVRGCYIKSVDPTREARK